MNGAVKKTDYQEIVYAYLAIAWRRKLWIVLPVILGTAVSFYLIKTLPKIYQSSTLILVEGQKVPQKIVEAAVTGTAEDRLSTIKQQVLSRSFLHRIIEKFNLYEKASAGKKMSQGAKINRIREDIEVETRGRRRLESFSISFKGENPETVMNVTNELASLVMEENLKIREEFVEGAIVFLDVELDNLKAELERQESRIGEYKRTHLGELPEQLDSNLRALDRYQANLDSIHMAKKAAQDRIVDLERMRDSAMRKDRESDFSGAPEVLAPSALKQQLEHRRQELTDLLTEYSEDYPDVLIMKRNILLLENKISNNKTEERPSSKNEAPSPSVVDDESQEVITLRQQIVKMSEEINFLVKKEKEIRAQIQLYEVRVENTPKREQEMIILRRDYDNIAGNYQALLNKKLNAKISENLEKRQKGEQFRIIDSANFPEKPISPNTLFIALLGVLGGFGFGLVMVFIREQLDNSIRHPEEVERITSMLVLAEIPDFSDEMKKREKHLKQKVVDLEQFAGRKKQLQRKGLKG